MRTHAVDPARWHKDPRFLAVLIHTPLAVAFSFTSDYGTAVGAFLRALILVIDFPVACVALYVGFYAELLIPVRDYERVITLAFFVGLGGLQWFMLGWVFAGVFGFKTVSLRRSKPENPRCHRCGYDLTGNLSGTCPECGLPR